MDQERGIRLVCWLIDFAAGEVPRIGETELGGWRAAIGERPAVLSGERTVARDKPSAPGAKKIPLALASFLPSALFHNQA